MFYREASNQYILEGVAFEIDGVGYPSNWLNLSTPEEKEALGLEEVIAVGERKDDRYYWVTEHLYKATLTYTDEAKNLDECKAIAIAQTKQTAYTLLLPSDWLTIRKDENGTEVPADWLAYREAVRQTTAAAIVAIEATTTVDELAALVINWPVSPDSPIPAPTSPPEEPVVEEPVVEPPAPDMSEPSA